MRLQKFLARSGVASRRGSEGLMTAGRVKLNGEIVTELGTKVDPDSDIVTVDGRIISLSTGPHYIMLHKPAGYLSTMSDPFDRPIVASLVPAAKIPGLFPVGRLDFDTTGLILFTTDGELSHRLLHPKWEVFKSYQAIIDGIATDQGLQPLRDGLILDDGPCAPASVEILSIQSGQTTVDITVSEGRKRQVRRMFSAVSHPVRHLHRYKFGAINLGDLAEGQHRELTQEEVSSLYLLVDYKFDDGSPQ